MNLEMAPLGVSHYGSFVVAVIGFLLVPGPGNLTLITSTGRGGIRAGIAATLGVILGDQLLLWAAVAGVAGVLLAHPFAFRVLQWLGALYLFWLGLKMLFARREGPPAFEMKPRHFFRQAVAITLTNPKAIFFYLAFLPLFVDPAHARTAATYVFLAATVAVLTFLYGLVAVCLTRAVDGKLKAHPAVPHLLTKLMGGFLVVFGIRLVITN